MADKKLRRMPLPLSLKNPLHAEALRIIESVPKGKRTEFICKKITAKESEELSPTLRKAIYDCVRQAILDQGGIALQQQSTTTEKNSEKEKTAEMDEIEKNFFGFLDTLAIRGE